MWSGHCGAVGYATTQDTCRSYPAMPQHGPMASILDANEVNKFLKKKWLNKVDSIRNRILARSL